MDTNLLVDWHLVLLRTEIADALLQDTNHKIMGQLVLIRESDRGDGFNRLRKKAISHQIRAAFLKRF
jgi:hypothetical protein